jgi:hypothetical protein
VSSRKRASVMTSAFAVTDNPTSKDAIKLIRVAERIVPFLQQ